MRPATQIRSAHQAQNKSAAAHSVGSISYSS